MKLVILGAGESGAGTAILAQKQGYEVFVSDMGQIKDKYKKVLDDHNIRWEEGKHTEAEILSATEVVKSPGIPDTAPMVRILLSSANLSLQSVIARVSASASQAVMVRLPLLLSYIILCRRLVRM